MQHQYSLSLITHKVDNSLVEQRAKDGYINATELCKVANKNLADYVRLLTTQNFLKELQADMGIPISELIQIVKGGNGPQGTWVHPQIAINLGQWLSARFAVQVSKWVYEWKIQEDKILVELPSHIKRYIANDHKIPAGHFSMLQETTLGLTAPLHNLGFEIPAGWVPDISVAKAFCKWLRDEKNVDTDALPKYMHQYQDSRGTQQANLYPDIYLAECRTWLKTVWLPTNGANYFKKKDPNCMQFFDKLPSIAAANSAQIKKSA